MEKNFVLGQSNELLQNGGVVDLHNHYEFSGVLVQSHRRVRLSFTPSAAHRNELTSIVLEVIGVDFLEFSAGFGTRDHALLEEVGYKNPGDHDLEWLVGQRQSTADDHLVFRFSFEDYIRVRGQRMELRSQNSQ